MKSLKLSKVLLLLTAVALLGTATVGCKKKVKDTDIQAAVEAALKADPTITGAAVAVKDKIATISGEVKDQAAKDAIEKVVAAVKDVKSVVNNLTVPPPPPVIAADDPLTKSVTDAIKDFPGVMASVKDGIITLTGEISKDKLQKLMMILQGLKPKKVETSGLVKK